MEIPDIVAIVLLIVVFGIILVLGRLQTRLAEEAVLPRHGRTLADGVVRVREVQDRARNAFDQGHLRRYLRLWNWVMSLWSAPFEAALVPPRLPVVGIELQEPVVARLP